MKFSASVLLGLSLTAACSATPVEPHVNDKHLVECSTLGHNNTEQWRPVSQPHQSGPTMCEKVYHAAHLLEKRNHVEKHKIQVLELNDKLRNLSAQFDAVHRNEWPPVVDGEQPWLVHIRDQQSINHQQRIIMLSMVSPLGKRIKLAKKLKRHGIDINTDLGDGQ